MKVSSIIAKISENDILEIIDEYVDVKGLNIQKIYIKDILIVHGTYTKGIKVPFRVEFGFGSVRNNTIMAKILKIQVSKLGLSVDILTYFINKVLKSLKDIGIDFKRDNIYIDIDILSKIIPFVYFKINYIKAYSGYLEIEAENIIYVKEKKVENICKENSDDKIKKIVDGYTKLRKNICDKVPKKYEKFVEYFMILPDLIVLLGRLMKDNRVEIKTKIIIGGTIAYLASPIEIIADVIPVIGQIDDISLTFFALDRIVNEVPEKVIIENWQGSEDIICKIKDGTKFIFNNIGTSNTVKILKYIASMKRKSNKK
ncbi:YkvA family protein [Clostridium guangxiense]|uniref:YkvA family protein n=2 Tax=Clostridium TaxID=1485 RepID=UPI001E4C6153|nr:DUF1232 domain-containing protein [Clostridium guangxiense]MCD2347347.1 DUF1232 domain-containing protein [Clostridium guangxiense]